MTSDLLNMPFCHLNDDDFNLAIFEMNHGVVNFDTNRLESQHFNPIRNAQLTPQTTDLDPDQQFLNLPDSKYFISEEFNQLYLKTNVDLSLLHLNARSINQNFDDKVTDFLNTIESNFSIIGISETWIKNSNNDIHINGYDFINNYREDRIGGGVGIFINNDLEYKHRQDLDYFDSNILETIFIEIIRPNQNNIIIGIVYRSPGGNLTDATNKFHEMLTKISREHKPCYLLGDYNIDLLKYQHHNFTNDFIDTMFSHLFLPLITHPTRVTSHTASLIDNIFTNHTSSELSSGIFVNINN